jgi:hypothetical protein
MTMMTPGFYLYRRHGPFEPDEYHTDGWTIVEVAREAFAPEDSTRSVWFFGNEEPQRLEFARERGEFGPRLEIQINAGHQLAVALLGR